MKPTIVDGISRPPAAPFPKDHLDDLNFKSHPQAKTSSPKTISPKKASSRENNPTVIILMTLIFMVLLIGLAYFAYNKSR